MYVSTVNSFNTVKDGDVSYKKQTHMMNDDSVSECEIVQLKKPVDLYSSIDFQ